MELSANLDLKFHAVTPRLLQTESAARYRAAALALSLQQQAYAI